MISGCLESAANFRREEVEVVLADGRPRRIGLSVSPICDASQNVEGALCLMTDITEVLELRERMKLKDNLANLGEMAAGLAHEFKNSLAQIVQIEDVPLRVLQTSGPYPDAVDLSTSPLAPNQSKPFRITLEHISNDWDRQYPAMQVTDVKVK